MAEYITKEQVIEWFRPYGHTDEGIPYYGLVTDIRGMKAADVAPVVHGRWKLLVSGNGVCSVCHFTTVHVWDFDSSLSYCPHCGATMDGGDSDAESV